MSKSDSGSIGRYELQKRLGDGGMGTVFLALDPIIERLVAIKLLRNGIDSETSRERIVREARAAGGLRHPNIVTIFDVGECEGEPFIAMEYIQGETLDGLIRRQAPISLSRRLEMVESICWGLQYAHDAGIIHRDIKPANVMVGEDGIVKILDFGIARGGATGLTQGIAGTLNYMAPEQLEGKTIDQRVDVFAVGAVLYELVCLRRAFPGGLADGVLAKILTAQPERLEAIIPSVHPSVVAIVNRCLEKMARDRYPDCRTLAMTIAAVRKELVDSDPASGDVTQLRISERGAPWIAAARGSGKTSRTTGQPNGAVHGQAPVSQRIALTGVTAFVAVLLAALSLWIATRPQATADRANRSLVERPETPGRVSAPTAVSRIPPDSSSTPIRREDARSGATRPGVERTTGLEAAGAPPSSSASALQPLGSQPVAEGSATLRAAGQGSTHSSGSLAPSAATTDTATVPSRNTGAAAEPSARPALPPERAMLFTDPSRRFTIEFPGDWRWMIVEGSQAAMVTFTQPDNKAAVIIEETHSRRDITLQNVNAEIADSEAAVIRETQTRASDVRARVAAQRIGRIVQIDYRRLGLGAPGKVEDQRVRQFSIPFNGALYRITCFASASRFGDYDATFQWMVESLRSADDQRR